MDNGLDAPIIAIVNDEINRLPTSRSGQISKVYDGSNRCDVITDTGKISYIECYGKTPTLASQCIIVFLENDFTKPVCIPIADNSGDVVDIVEDGNMNAVTSNAVYDAINTAVGSIEDDMNR